MRLEALPRKPPWVGLLERLRGRPPAPAIRSWLGWPTKVARTRATLMNSGRSTLALTYNYHVVARCNRSAVRCSCVRRVAHRGEIGTRVACARPSNNASRIDRTSGPLLRSSHGWSEAWFVSNKRLLPTAATLVVGWSLGELSGGVGVFELQSSTAAAADAQVIASPRPKMLNGVL